MAILNGVPGLEVAVILQSNKIPMNEHHNNRDRATRSHWTIKYIEAKTDHDFGVKVAFRPVPQPWDENEHYRLNILIDGNTVVSDDIHGGRIRDGFSQTYNKAKHGTVKTKFFFNALQANDDDDGPLGDLGVIDVQFHPLKIIGYKNQKDAGSRGTGLESASGSKPRVTDWRTAPTHSCSLRPESYSRARKNPRAGAGYDIPKPRYAPVNLAEGARFRFTFKCRSAAKLRDLRLLSYTYREREKRKNDRKAYENKVRNEFRDLPFRAKEEDGDDDVIFVSQRNKNTNESRAEVRRQALEQTKTDRHRKYQRLRRDKHRKAEASVKRGESEAGVDDNEAIFESKEIVPISSDEEEEPMDRYADGDPGSSRLNGLFVDDSD